MKLLIGLLLLFGARSASATVKVNTAVLQDSFLLVRKAHKVTVKSGQEIKIWGKKSPGIKCTFLHLDNDTLSVRMQDKVVRISTTSISHIKIIHPRPARRIFGGVLMGMGITALTNSLITATLSLAGVATGSLAVAIALFIPLFLIIGIVLIVVGLRLGGKKYKISNRWQIRK